MVDELLGIQDPEKLAKAIKDRLRGEHHARPRRDDWILTDAVYSVAERAIKGAARECLASAILLLFQELSDTSDAGRLLLEWPAGLFRVAARVAWTESERNTLKAYIQTLVPAAGNWPIGHESVPGLSSPRLEFLRLARFVELNDESMRSLLERTIRSLVSSQRESIPFVSAAEQNREFGALLGIAASLGFMERALEHFLDLQDEPRDRVFRAFVQEFERWENDGTKLQPALLHQYDRNSLPRERSAPSCLDQRWAAGAAQWVGEPINEHVRRTIERLTAVPSASAPPKTTNSPAFAKTAS